jgi:hypothetical protein
LHQLLTNVAYRGQIRYKQEVHPGEHAAIVDPSTWQQVQRLLQGKRPRPGSRLGNGALLQGRLRCVPCGCVMSSSHTTKGTRRYRYYVCSQAQKRGWQTCPAPSVPAGEIERLVTRQIQGLSAGPADESWWEALPAVAQARVVQRLVERVDYDGVQGTVAITFAADAARALAEQRLEETEA